MNALESYLKDLKAITEKVSPPPWKYRHGTTMDHWELWSDKDDDMVWEIQDDSGVEPSTEFLEFIATSRSAVPKLIEVCEVLMANLKWVTADPATKPDYLVEKARTALDRVNNIVEEK